MDAFWTSSISESRAKASQPAIEQVQTPLKSLDVFDLEFSGFGGQRIKAWLRVPSGIKSPLRTIVQFVGYGGGRGFPAENLLIASAGFAHLYMDTRGQGAAWSVGDTPDDSPPDQPQSPGVLTKGISSRETYYYRRLMIDAILAVDAAGALEMVDEHRIGVLGGSQGGALAIAAAAYSDKVRAAAIRVPFMSDIPHAVSATDAYPYREVADYLAIHRSRVGQILETLSYFDTSAIASRALAPAIFSVGLMDEITPPSTVFAAYNAYAGPKSMQVWPYNGHEAGGHEDEIRELDFFSIAL